MQRRKLDFLCLIADSEVIVLWDKNPKQDLRIIDLSIKLGLPLSVLVLRGLQLVGRDFESFLCLGERGVFSLELGPQRVDRSVGLVQVGLQLRADFVANIDLRASLFEALLDLGEISSGIAVLVLRRGKIAYCLTKMLHGGLEKLILNGELVLDLLNCNLEAGGRCILSGVRASVLRHGELVCSQVADSCVVVLQKGTRLKRRVIV